MALPIDDLRGTQCSRCAGKLSTHPYVDRTYPHFPEECVRILRAELAAERARTDVLVAASIGPGEHYPETNRDDDDDPCEVCTALRAILAARKASP
jgi:hypothetical protein